MTAATAAATTTTTATTTRRLPARAVATAATIPATTAIYLVGAATGVDFRLTDAMGSVVLTLPVIVSFTAVFALLGLGSFALLDRLGSRGATVWTALAAAVTALSLVPIFLEQASPATEVALVLVHLAVAAVLVPGLRRTARR